MVDQNSQFYAILTNVGAAKQANADALGIAWKITQMGVGDANDTEPTPNASQISLINEWRRAPLNQLKIDDKDNSIIVAEQVIPAEVGGRWIREIGLYDADGDLVAVANCPPTYKPLLNQGSGRTQVVRMNLVVSSSSNVQLKIDPGVVLATRQYVDQLTVRASQAEAEAGQENSKIMTPLRVFQAIAKVVKQATESAFGWAKIATQAQVDAGSDDTTIVSPKKLRATFASLGYLVDDAPYLNTVLKHSKAGNYIGFGGGNPKATAGVPELFADPTRNSLLNIEAFRPRADITFYRLWEATGIEYEGIYTEGAASINWRRVSSDGFPASELLAGPAKIATQAQITAGADDSTIITPKKLRAAQATQAEAEGGVDNTKTMTPLRVFQAIAAAVTQATEAAFGWARIATQAQVTAGTDDATIITPKKLRAAQATQLEAEAGTDNTKTMTPLRVSQAIAKVVGQATEAAFGWAKIATQAQVTTGTDDATIITPKKLRDAQATQLEAEAGTDNTKTMTPLRVFQAIAKVVGQATEAAFGWAKIATQVQVTTGTDDATIITPKKLRDAQASQVEAETGADNTKWMSPLRVFQAIAKRVFTGLAYSSAPNGYIVLPQWMGSFVFQWGAFSHGEATNFVAVSVPFNIGFPTTCYNVQCISDAGTTTCDLNGITAVNVGVTIAHRETSGPVVAGSLYWFAIGK